MKQVTKIKVAQFAPLIMLFFTIGSVTAANNRVWDTVFFGQEIVGEYVGSHTEFGDRIIAFAHSQGMAVCSYARRGCGGVANLTEFRHKEKVFDIDFVYIDMSQFNDLQADSEMFKYISENYRIELVGVIKSGDKFIPLHMLLKKGGIFNMSSIQSATPELKKSYDLKRGNVEYYWVRP